MKSKLRNQLRKRKRQTLQRIDQNLGRWQSPMFDPPTIKYELAEKQEAIGAGGLGMVMQLIKQLELRQEINRAIPLLKLHLPYDEASSFVPKGINDSGNMNVNPTWGIRSCSQRLK